MRPLPISAETAQRLAAKLNIPLERLMHMPQHILLQRLQELAEKEKQENAMEGGTSMSTNLAIKFGTGLQPQAFIDEMTKNKEAFLDWHDRFAWKDEADRAFFASLQHRDDLRCLILAADWCGDVVRNVPVLFRVLAETGIPTEVLIMEEHLDVMDQFLTMGGRSIPIAIFTDTGGHVLGKWGPRPQYVQEAMVAFKQANPDRNAPDYEEKLKETRAEILRRYGEDTGYQDAIVKELRQLLSSF